MGVGSSLPAIVAGVALLIWQVGVRADRANNSNHMYFQLFSPYPPRIQTSPSDPSVSPLPPPKSDLPPSPSNTMPALWKRHTVKQLKLVLPGALLTYYLDTIHVFLSILHGNGGFWARCGYLNRCVLNL